MDEQKAITPQQPSTVSTNSKQIVQPNPSTNQPSGIPLPTSPKPKKSFLKKPLFWITIIIIIVFAGAYYFIYSHIDNQVRHYTNESRQIPSPSETSVESPTLTPDLSFDIAELNGFPVYPQTKFVGKSVNECKSVSGFSSCQMTTYEWETPNNGDTVLNWYKDDNSESGWVCGKGGFSGYYAGTEDLFSKGKCSKNNLEYTLFILADPGKTQITVGIPFK